MRGRGFNGRVVTVGATIGAKEVASLLGLSRSEVYRDLAEGNIPAKRRGSRYVIYRADVERLVDEGTLSALPKAPPVPTDVATLLAALAGDGDVTFEITVRRKSKTG